MTQNNFLKLMGLFFICCLLSTSCLAQRERSQVAQVVAMVNGNSIKEDELRYRLMMYQSPLQFLQDKAVFQSLKKQTLQEMIRRRAIIDWGTKNGLTLSPEEQSNALEKAMHGYTDKEFEEMLANKGVPYSVWSHLIAETAGAEKVLREAIYKKITISEAEITSYYNRHIDEFQVGERAHVRQIVTDSEAKANQLHVRLLQGENFAQMAIQHSISPDRAQGGDLGYIIKGRFPKEFDDVCFNLKPGEISPVIKTAYGFHIFKLIDIKPKGVLELNNALNRIESELLAQKVVEVTGPWTEKVLQESVIQIRDNVLDAMEL